MHTNRYLSAAVGFFVLLSMTALAFLSFQTSNLSSFRLKNPYELTAMFNDVSGLSKQAAVTISGVQIGRVKSITYDPSFYKAKVILEISGEFNQLPLDSSADILTAGLLGEKYIGIVAGGDEIALQNGDTIQFTGSSMVLEKLIQQFVSQISTSK